MRRSKPKRRHIATNLRCSPRIAPLVAGRGRIYRFRDLPRPAQFAIIHYMSVDGEAWVHPTDLPGSPQVDWWEADHKWRSRDRRVLAPVEVYGALLDKYVARYGDTEWGYAEIPMVDLATSVMQDQDIADWGEFDHYRDWYARQGVPRHPATNRWPVILSSKGDQEETLQDGWHRFHSYYRSGAQVVPAVWFPE